MKKWLLRSGLTAALLLAIVPASALALGVGIGAFGGTSIPVLQEDTGSGSQFGIRVPVSVAPLLTVEPYWATSSGGDKDQEVGGVVYTRSGIDVTSFGANLLFTFGTTTQLYPYVGIGSNQLKRDGLDDTETGYTFGLGLKFGVGMPGLALHVRGGMNAVLEENGDTARKWADVNVGLSYHLYPMSK